MYADKQKQIPALKTRGHTRAWFIPVTSHLSLAKIFTNHKSNCLWIKWGPRSIWQCHLQFVSWNIPTLIPVNAGTNKKSTTPIISSIRKFPSCHFMVNNCNNKPTVKGTNILLLLKYNMYVNQGCTNPWRQLTVETKFCMVASNISLSLVRNVLHITLLAPRILRWLLHF